VNRDDAWKLVNEYVTKPGLVNHMRSVEIALRAYARKFGEDEELWGIVGLLHDFDYERWPDPPNHPLEGSKILRQLGYPEEVIYAIQSHADYLPDAPRVASLHKALYACDEMCGFLVAAALVRPTGIVGMTASSVRKKLKNKLFAKNVSRDDLERGAKDFGVELSAHVQFLIDALTPFAEELGVQRGLSENSEAE
jgi:putative nucleotidyltransferase with HDIG domain